MSISASLVKELRDMTGAGMMDCKTALTETNGDIEAAVDWLRKKGISKADKKAGRTAAEGLIGVASDDKGAVVVEVNSETDFVARNDAFQDLVRNIAQAALGTDGSVEAVAAASYSGGAKPIAEAVKDAIATIGENMTLRRSARLDGTVATYVHNAVSDGLGKLGVLVAIETTGDKDAARAIGRQIAMHVAATNPMSLDETSLDPAAVERERAIFSEQARASGKPDNIIEKMVEGRLRKFYEEVCLVKQAFVINPDLTVEKALAEAEK
ncbi:MAG: translation elongation factor Ts, partial [Oricola sp.]